MNAALMRHLFILKAECRSINISLQTNTDEFTHSGFWSRCLLSLSICEFLFNGWVNLRLGEILAG